VRKLVLYFCFAGLALGQTPQPTDTVLAWKPETPHMHGGSGWPRLPYSLWESCGVRITAKSPVLNAGATNTQWICYAKHSAGNATQTIINSQPLWVLVDGVWRLRFDATDDHMLLPNAPYQVGTNNFTIAIDMMFPWKDSGSVSGNVFSFGFDSNWPVKTFGFGDTVIAADHFRLIFMVGRSTGGTFPSLNTDTLAAGRHVIVVRRISEKVFEMYINGVFKASMTHPDAALSFDVVKTARLGRGNENPGRFFGGDIFDFMFFDRALTTNEIWSISQ
jgi:hypothetical protein